MEAKPEPQLNILVVDQDHERAATTRASIEQFVETCVLICSLDELDASDGRSEPDVVFVAGSVVALTLAQGLPGLRPALPRNVVLIGYFEQHASIEPVDLIQAGFDLLLFEPFGRADIERAIRYASSLLHETPEQSRARMRKMNALHQLAINTARWSQTDGWLQQIISTGREILNCDALALWMLDNLQGRVQCVASVGLSREYIEAASNHSDQLVSIYAGLPTLVSSHWMSESAADPDDMGIVAPDAAREAGIWKIGWLPVRDANRIFGHLSFYFSDEASFYEYDLVLADAFAAIVTESLNNHSLAAEISRSNRLYRELIELSPDGVLVCRPDRTIERANESIEQIAGRSRYELLGTDAAELFLNYDDLPWEDWLDLDFNVRAESIDAWLVCPDRSRRRVSCYARRIQLPFDVAFDHSEDRLQLVLEDVTEQTRRLVELEILHDLTRVFSERRPIEEGYELVVSRLYEFFNYRFVSVGVLVDDFYLIHGAVRFREDTGMIPDHFDASMGICGRAIRENRSRLVTDVGQDPEYYSIDDTVTSELVALIRSEGNPIGLIDIQSDETLPLDKADLDLASGIASHLGLLIEQNRASERLQSQAMTDPLTGIANRRAFMAALHKLVEEPGTPPTGLFLVEIDRFKDVNDRFGHQFGDEMLIQVSRRLQSEMRTGDMVSRYGGDELAVIFTNLRAERAFEVAERLRRAISETPFEFHGMSTDLTVSIGIALYPAQGRTPDQLVGEADRAMYRAKLEGRNRVFGEVPGI